MDSKSTGPGSNLTDIQKTLLDENVVKKVKNIISNFSTNHRDIHSSVSKIGKAIDKNFVSDYVCVGNENLFDEPDNAETVVKAIVEHFFRTGKSSIAEELIHESKLNIATIDKIPYVRMNAILGLFLICFCFFIRQN